MGKLIKCKECGGLMSKSAKSCPHCGSTHRYNMIMTLVVYIPLAVLAAYVGIKVAQILEIIAG